MKFLRVEWTRKRGVIALLATGLVVTSFILGGYVATGNWNPWGNRHYYQVLNANFQECYTPLGGSPECQSVHNVMDITGATNPQSSTVVTTFTDTTAATSVAQSCLVNQAANASVNRVSLAAATFTAITLQIGDTIQITWSISWTWS